MWNVIFYLALMSIEKCTEKSKLKLELNIYNLILGEDLYSGKNLWNRWVLSLEWKREEVMVVTDDERGWRNEAETLFQRLGDA